MKNYSILLLALLVLSGCGKGTDSHEGHDHAEETKAASVDEHGHEEEGHSDPVKLTEEAQAIAGIETTVVRMEDFQQVLQAPGTVSSTDKGKAVVTPPVAGRVISISARLGDSVRQGQTLAVIESPELSQSWSSIADATRLRDAARSEVQQARSEVALAQAKVNAAKTNLSRQRDLASAGAFSQAPVQQAQNELNDAQSELLSIQKEQASHAEQVRRLENLYRDGIVSKSELEAARLELQQDQIKLERANSRIATAKATYERERNIASRGLLNARELQTAEAEVKASELELERARLRVRGAESALSNAERGISNAQAVYRSNSGSGRASVGRVSLVAPISGVITHLDVTRGQAVDRTQVLLEVENLRSVWVTANVSEAVIEKVRKGSSMTFTTASLPDREFEGVVQIVGTRVDPKTRSIPVQCLVTEARGMLKPDMFAKVFIGIGQASAKLVIPTSAVVKEGTKSFVFAKHDDAFEKHEVTLGEQSGNRVVVLSGVEEGETIASKGAFILASEQKKSELKGHEH
ncbi:MAG: efflux RND transporter periplasmic adaptor subunit [Fimbriimonadaceae bacterium]|nr:efflux RND transporter periplasmic adaptor subunit [Fimbriimonadaceae bacterium]QYK58154.1 MAG: efflux RND transporter periplasmic adaptor subunit [Fimbriimonadaceae bacterium]